LILENIPHFSQLNLGLANLCSQACVAMLTGAYTDQSPNPYDVAIATQTADGKPKSIAQLLTMLRFYGIACNNATTGKATLNWHKTQIAHGIPTIALLRYKYLYPGHWFTGAHFLCVVGFDDDGVFIHDPLQTASYVHVSNARFDAAIRDMELNYPYQAVYPLETLPMSLKGLGLNIHTDYLDNYDLLKTRLKAAPPPALLCMDNLPRALELKALLPQTTHIYRHFRSTSDYTVTTPEQWIAMHEYAGGKGLWLQADNEAPLTEAFCAWSLKVAQLCVARKWQVCLLNLSVGHPEPDQWSRADALLRFIAANPQYCMIGIHEYAPTLMNYDWNTESDPEKFPTVKPTDRPWLLGRFRFLLDYCKSKGIKAPKIVINEWGWDTIASATAWHSTTPGYRPLGMGYRHSSVAWTTWQPGMTAAQHAFKQLQWAWNNIYKPHPEIVGVCFFCYGGLGGEGSWGEDYSIHRENELFDLVKAQGNFALNTGTTPPPQPPTDPPGLQAYITGATVVNARALPTTSSVKIGEVRTGQAINSILEVRYIAPYTWLKVNGVLSDTVRDYWFAAIGDSWRVDIR
jgi:hypothetical protein